MKLISTVRKNVHNRLLRLRQLDRLVESDDFAKAYEAADSGQCADIIVFLRDAKVLDLKYLVRKILRNDLPSKSYGELRDLAIIEQVPNYSRMNKQELLKALQEHLHA